jgi:hypothetical protein
MTLTVSSARTRTAVATSPSRTPAAAPHGGACACMRMRWHKVLDSAARGVQQSLHDQVGMTAARRTPLQPSGPRSGLQGVFWALGCKRAARCRRTLEDALEDLSELVRRSRRALEAALRALLPAELLPQFLH